MRNLLLYVMAWNLVATAAWAGILGNQQQVIDFTKPEDAAKLARWSTPEHLGCTLGGFGWEGEKNTSRDGWLETEPLAIGTSWRPPQGAGLRVKLSTNYPAVVATGPSSKAFYVPSLFVRHSPDRVHWSDWQPLKMEEDPRNPGSVLYSANIGVPSRSTASYHTKLLEWSRRDDIAWGSDEHEFCEWLIKDDPQFFEKNRPFVGYVQFLVEGSFKGGQRLTRLEADVTWGVGGIHTFPKKPGADKRSLGMDAWNFRGEPKPVPANP